MPRKKYEIVQDHPAYRPNRWYLLRVLEITRQGRPLAFHVSLENLDQEQAGRVHQVDLPLPIMPSGLSSSFFNACGFDTSVGARIAYEDATGKTALAKFTPSPDGDWQVAAFEPVSKELPDDG